MPHASAASMVQYDLPVHASLVELLCWEKMLCSGLGSCSIAEGGVTVGVAKISAMVSLEGDAAVMLAPHLDFKCWRYFAATTGCWHSFA